MFRSIWDDIIHYFRTGNMIVRLILINIAIFVIINIAGVFLNAGNGFTHSPNFNYLIEFFSVHANFKKLVFRPWGLFTCMFLQHSFWHLFWNMILLYWFGRIAGDLLNDRRILPLYVLGGLFGAVCFIVFSNLLHIVNPTYGMGYSLGASGAVMAVTMAAGVIAPDYRINLILFETKLKYIVGVIIFFDILGVSTMAESSTDHFAHLGGAFFGWYFVYMLRKGVDFSEPFNRYADNLLNIVRNIGASKKPKRPQPKVAYTNKEKIQQSQQPHRQSDNVSLQDRVDAILDKISKQGIGSLTDEEQNILNDYRNKL